MDKVEIMKLLEEIRSWYQCYSLSSGPSAFPRRLRKRIENILEREEA